MDWMLMFLPRQQIGLREHRAEETSGLRERAKGTYRLKKLSKCRAEETSLREYEDEGT